MPLLGKHARDEEEEVYTLADEDRREKRLRDDSEDDFAVQVDASALFQKWSLPTARGFTLPLFVPPLDPSGDSEASDDSSPLSLASLPSPTAAHDIILEESADDISDSDLDDDTLLISPKTRTINRPFPRPPRLSPAALHSHASSPTSGRADTPIKGYFNQDFSCGRLSSPPLIQSGPFGAYSIQSKTLTLPCNTRQREHWIPTPVTEAPIETPSLLAGFQLSRLTVAGEENMDMDDKPIVAPTTSSSSSSNNSNVGRGRRRSGAISDKRRFVMGYREDCEKCRQQVPGHFSHFL